jgi:hypothetical protein
MPPNSFYITFVPETPPMDTYFFEIQDAPGEIYDIEDSADEEIFDIIPEEFDRTKFIESDEIDANFIQMLNSNYTL